MKVIWIIFQSANPNPQGLTLFFRSRFPNGLENFWSLLKRTLKGTYISVDPVHLFRYLDEQVFRYNNRKENDAARFLKAALAIIGKRLTYAKLINGTQPA